MNGIESLLLIIVGILSIKFSFYIAEEYVPDGWQRKMFLLISAYAWIAFISGNIMFFLWLFNEYFSSLI